MADIKGKIVLISGGTSGIGASMATVLAEAGAHVIIASRDNSKGEQFLRPLADRNLEMKFYSLDLQDEASCYGLAEQIGRDYPRLDVLINNAAVGMNLVHANYLKEPRPFYEVSGEVFDTFFKTNTYGVFHLTKACLPLLKKSARGKIINVTINQNSMERKGFTPYGPSKAAAESMSRIMAKDLEPLGIAVNLFSTGGATRTGMMPEISGPEELQNFLDPMIVAEPIQYLVSDESNHLVDQRIVAKDWQKDG